MKILFICTHNRCRSILSEAISNHLSGGRLTAYSAGSQPAEQVHPLSIKYLQQQGIKTDGLHSKSWGDVETINPDIVITVCDSAANEACPVWFGNTIKVHWGLPDPSKVEGADQAIEDAFNEVIALIKQRVQTLLDIDFEALTPAQLSTRLHALAEEH